MEKEPKLIIGNTVGSNNEELEKAVERVERSKMYQDLSTIIVCPTRGMFPTRVVQSWMKLIKPANQRVAGPIFAEAMRVDVAYETLFEYILNNDYLKTFKYVLTIEEDNLPPADGLIKLYESMENYDVVGGLYWAKGDDGFPMIFGEAGNPGDYKPQKPKIGELQPANGLGMGFNLFKLDMFRNIPKPWFKTVEEKDEYGNTTQMTQDLHFYKKAGELGYKFACDNKILVGHYESKTDIIY